MDNFAYIDNCLNEEISPEQKKAFEQRIVDDPVFAEEVAFFLAAKKAIAEEKSNEKERFRELYEQYNKDNPSIPPRATVKRLWPYIAAAAAIMVGIVFGWNFLFRQPSSQQMADEYVQKQFQALPVSMGGGEDSLQQALRLYNEGSQEQALQTLEILAQKDTTFIDAIKYAGIVSLQTGEYDKAIQYFTSLSKFRLYTNPGKFYQALTLMKRNRPGDKQQAKLLLDDVVQNNLEGKEMATQWLKKW